ncbi:RLP50 [Arabidopsis thaliana]|uniref:RLP50 n=2 Tax=Arabidopsis thaliana TaxID=3702 RepID=A0A178UTM6_ARATH|nr:RLP50 [Arabidopsis thaliana]
MITIIWSLCLIFCLSNSILVIAKDLCLPDQRDALLEFKNEFSIPSPDSDLMLILQTTAKWRNNTDCCSWGGISCDPKTGVVVELDLGNSDLNGRLRSNSSLFRLQHLQSLDLSYNDLSCTLPDSIGNFKYLRVLNLLGCNLFGEIPTSLRSLSYLTDLDLSYNDDLTGEILDSMGNLKHLRVLSLTSCKFTGKIPSSLGNLTYLTDLDLSWNYFTGELPDSMGNLKSLRVLNLHRCNFFGKIPTSLGSLSNLTDLDISKNEFTSEGPDSMSSLNRLTDFQLMLLNLSSLTNVDLSSNQFKAMLPSNMSSLSKLEAFDISGNSFSGTIPSSLFMIPSLIKLDLGTNDFSGPLKIGNISSPSNLQELYIGENNINGPIPRSILKLVGLSALSLSFWDTGGIVDFSIFLQLKSLRSLDLSGINLNISSSHHLPSHMMHLILSSCNISQFPKFLENQTSLYHLDISANQIEGQVPEWLWRLPTLRYVNIAQNAFSGELTMLPNPIYSFIASDNKFSGEIPRAVCEIGTLVLSNNNFSGSIPPCFEISNKTLSILHLRNNSLSGVIPEESLHGYLRSLDVGSNRLSGQLPKSLINCSYLQFLNVEENRINDTFPSWLKSLPNLQLLVLRSNEFHGPIFSPGDSLSFPKLRFFDISENRFSGVLPSDYFVGWSVMSSFVDIIDNTPGFTVVGDDQESFHKSVVLTIKGLNMELVGSGFEIYKTIDVSRNRLEGDIPESIGILKELIVLNMSNNAFTGHLPPSLSNLSNLQSLDLSQNRLSGSIPGELGELTFLARMNFSYNMLEGPIPQGTQIQSQNSSSFIGNPSLCGAPLQKKCGGEEEEEKEEKDKDKVFSWIAAAIGYVPGLFCGLAIAHILTSYKLDWFMRIFSCFSSPLKK